MFLLPTAMPREQSRKLAVMCAQQEKQLGVLPPHFQLLGTISPEILEEALAYLFRLMKHPRIAPDIFTWIRFHMASREGYAYCIAFNRGLLRQKGYSEAQIAAVAENIAAIPGEEREQALAAAAIKAISRPSDRSLTATAIFMHKNYVKTIL